MEQEADKAGKSVRLRSAYKETSVRLSRLYGVLIFSSEVFPVILYWITSGPVHWECVRFTMSEYFSDLKALN